ncbi:RNA-splicing factor [Emydomyces testavorans]|uniref:RNA-splicing factor n=1 Tax=Emydomyces testavorans TaxID=2070801 RepID=A0AAF0DQK5_9EURO|nr:RNA-splicing factor [Emydomyces testavorans]
MSSNVGLSTPRGSGTSGYVQRNLSLLKPRDDHHRRGYGGPFAANGDDAAQTTPFRQRQPDRQILEHDRRRQIELRVLEERERLEEGNEGRSDDGDGKAKEEKKKGDGLSEEEIERRLEELRARLTRELEDELAGHGEGDYRRGEKRKGGDFGGGGGSDGGGSGKRRFKTYQVHEQAEAKIEESERFRRALGIKVDGEDGPRREGRRRDWDTRPDREGRGDRDGCERRERRYREDRDERDDGYRGRYRRDDSR